MRMQGVRLSVRRDRPCSRVPIGTIVFDELDELYPNSGDVTVIATGGLAPLVMGVAESIDYHEEDLTLIGLRLIHERNR